ncbi:ABC transporter permease [Tumebacillus sp. ITR2]|uniref:ABC transporter permease n=1 Tax=Tumebacillus amylolyticus TaxID=2801339 RepID=A0ABS1J6E9_9BACL|nr:ABC transporter permease [Tumebacillus amylolyticus]MBL0385853.1 ABC transporter permease [Tumebacillus amylolyticus]
MGNAQKALVMAAGIFLAIALITIAVVMFISAQEATKSAQENFSGIQRELSSTSFNVYDGTTISGSQVVNALRKFSQQKQFGVLVITGRNKIATTPVSGGTWYNGVVNESTGIVSYDSTLPASSSNVVPTSGYSQLADSTTQSATTYINPAGRFNASIIRDDSNVIHGLKFVQQ